MGTKCLKDWLCHMLRGHLSDQFVKTLGVKLATSLRDKKSRIFDLRYCFHICKYYKYVKCIYFSNVRDVLLRKNAFVRALTPPPNFGNLLAHCYAICLFGMLKYSIGWRPQNCRIWESQNLRNVRTQGDHPDKNVGSTRARSFWGILSWLQGGCPKNFINSISHFLGHPV